MRIGKVTRRALGAAGAALLLGAGGVALVLGVVRWRGNREIREAYTAAFDAPPVVSIERCPDEGPKLERLQPLFDLALRAYKAVKRFDEPLPADLAADLMATSITGLVADYRCLLADGTDRHLLMGAIANLFLHKGEALLADGRTDAGYAHVVEGLSVYDHPRTLSFIFYLGAGYTFDHVQKLLDRYPAPPAVLERLEQTAAAGLLSRPQFCAGIKAEYLAQTYTGFYDRLAPLRARVAERWSERFAKASALVAANDKFGDLNEWRMTQDVFTPLLAGCLDPREPPLEPLEKAARAKLAPVPKGVFLGFHAPYTLTRVREFGALQDQFLLFTIDVGRRRLRSAGVPFDAAAIRTRILGPTLPVPLRSAWDGSTAAVEYDPAVPGGIVVIRGQFRQALPPLRKP